MAAVSNSIVLFVREILMKKINGRACPESDLEAVLYAAEYYKGDLVLYED